MKKCLFLIAVFFSCISIVHAGFEITEIMYDAEGTDTNREWVEVQNTGTTPDDLSKWYLFSDNTKHALVPEGTTTVEPQGYAIIAQNISKFKIDYPNYTGLLFDSSWSGFNNETETISLKDPNQTVVSPVAYNSAQGGAGDGTSLQKIGTGWKGGASTPGQVNELKSSTETAYDESEGESLVATPTKKKEIEIPRITTEIISKAIVVSSLSFPLKAVTRGYNKEPLNSGRFLWNFGDGMTLDEPSYRSFDYIYAYPGDYIISLFYYQNYSELEPIATDRISIKVLPPEVSIISVGKDKDPFIELENKSTIEIPLSGWIMKAREHSFTAPKGMVILPGKKLKIPSRITHFTHSDITSVVLQNPNGETISFYPATLLASEIVATISPTALHRGSESKYDPVDINTLPATAKNAVPKDVPSSLFAWIGLGGVILIGVASVLFIRDRKQEEDIMTSDENVE